MTQAVAERNRTKSVRNENESSMQIVSFCLGDEEYGIQIGAVREIILMGDLTELPQTPPYLKGLINLRSTVIPIVDLKRRFGMPESPATDETRIIVVSVGGKTIGLIVDSVSEVLRLSQASVSPPPPTIAGLGPDYLVGLAQLEGRLLILLDIETVLQDESEGVVATTTASE